MSSSLLLSGAMAKPGDIYSWITKQHARREDDEAKRLLYVAATRASEELHLLGTATVKMPKNGIQELTSGDKHSLLGIAWQALKADFQKAYAQQSRKQRRPSRNRLSSILRRRGKTIALRRLPVDWESPQTNPVSNVPENNLRNRRTSPRLAVHSCLRHRSPRAAGGTRYPRGLLSDSRGSGQLAPARPGDVARQRPASC